jgi:hypothetical protein
LIYCQQLEPSMAQHINTQGTDENIEFLEVH